MYHYVRDFLGHNNYRVISGEFIADYADKNQIDTKIQELLKTIHVSDMETALGLFKLIIANNDRTNVEFTASREMLFHKFSGKDAYVIGIYVEPKKKSLIFHIGIHFIFMAIVLFFNLINFY